MFSLQIRGSWRYLAGCYIFDSCRESSYHYQRASSRSSAYVTSACCYSFDCLYPVSLHLTTLFRFTAMKDYSNVNFGSIIGNQAIAPLNLLETASVHDALGIGSVSSKFGTAPNFWNAVLGFMAQLPPSLLSNEDIMRNLSIFSMPIVRLVDYFAGATNAMRCDVTCEKEPSMRATAIYGHENLELCVGECVAAFCSAILTQGAVPPGVWFPEQAISGGTDAADVLNLAGVSAHTLQIEAQGLKLEISEVWGVGSLSPYNLADAPF